MQKLNKWHQFRSKRTQIIEKYCTLRKKQTYFTDLIKQIFLLQIIKLISANFIKTKI